MTPEEIIKRAQDDRGWQPLGSSEALAQIAQAWIDERRHQQCEVCDEPIDLEERPRTYFCSKLMGDPPPLVCKACFTLWYDGGMTDPVAMKAERDKQRKESTGISGRDE